MLAGRLLRPVNRRSSLGFCPLRGLRTRQSAWGTGHDCDGFADSVDWRAHGCPVGRPTEHGGVIVLGEPTVIIGEVGMGGAGTAIGMGMAMAQTSAVACPSDNPSKYSVPAAPPRILHPCSFYKAQEAAASPDPASSPAAVQDAGPAANGANNAIAPDVVKEIVCGLTAGSVQIHCQHKDASRRMGCCRLWGRLAEATRLHAVPALLAPAASTPPGRLAATGTVRRQAQTLLSTPEISSLCRAACWPSCLARRC